MCLLVTISLSSAFLPVDLIQSLFKDTGKMGIPELGLPSIILILFVKGGALLSSNISSKSTGMELCWLGWVRCPS